MPLILDASVATAWAFEDESEPYTDRVLDTLARDSAMVPAIWPLEVMNAVLAGERRKRIVPADTIRFADLLRGLPIKVDAAGMEQVLGPVLNLARTHKLTAYDASYLELALRAGLPLATQDQRLRMAARQLELPIIE